ncbi:bestrophin-like domain [Hymenobacter yonginensis]|uniref:DUF4239 domain-containing protein n=1 Tax=Hymenobacter yonginensis TaxID=748197 RepID=A0ABY7PQ27_9BACT|nr:DUF4239 domain-containing protein [Hymenobacter yonginensis]WBO85122.1 DUF4239 domain-containing protein [Hymenobacter yonginensis]
MASDPLWEASFYSVDPSLQYMLWMYEMPTWLLALCITGTTVLVSLIGLYFAHRRLHGSAAAALIDNGTVGWFFSGVTVLYGLTLGLLTVATWQNYSDASAIASQEAASLAVLYRDLSGYPDSTARPLQAQLRSYTEFIVQKSWPAQRQGMANDTERRVLTRFQLDLLRTNVRTMSQQVLHGEAIETFNRLVELRRQRIESISSGVPGVLWAAVLLGAVITIAFSYCFVVENLRFHALLTSLLALMVGIMIFLIAALDHPYLGDVSVTPDAYQVVLDKVMVPLSDTL